ncbi:MAG: hypothetical protein U0V87_09315 [Acidobacteriota bacterium]
MNRSLSLLIVQSLVGRLRRALRLARQPKYLVGALIGMLYLVWCLFTLYRRDWAPRDRTLVDLIGASDSLISGLMLLGALALALFLSLAWLLPRGKSLLPLNDTEVHVLLSAPISRRSVIGYALLKGQVPLLLSAVILPIVFKPGPLLARLITVPGYWVALTLIDWHMKAANLWKLQTDTLSRLRARRRYLALYLVLGLFWIVALALLASRIDAVRSIAFSTPISAGFAHWISSVAEPLGDWRADTSLVVWLAPMHWTLAPLQPLSAWDLWRHLWPALVLVVVHYEWLVRSDAPFEEPILAGERVNTPAGALSAVLIKMNPRRRRRQPFRLAPTGWPEVAIVWKSLSLTFRSGVARALIVAFAILAVIAAAGGWGGSPQWLMIVLLAVGIAGSTMACLGAGFVRASDLRADLQRCDLLRTWPISGARLVAAYSVGIAVTSWLVGVISLACLLSADVCLRLSLWLGTRIPDPEILDSWSAGFGVPAAMVAWLAAVGVLPLLAAICLMSASLNTISVLAWPGWLGASDTTARGLAAIGQRILLGAGLMVALLVTLLPSAVLVVAVLGTQHWLDLPFVAWEFPLLGLLAAAPPVGAAFLVIRLGGRLWDRIDPSLEILA